MKLMATPDRSHSQKIDTPANSAVVDASALAACYFGTRSHFIIAPRYDGSWVITIRRKSGRAEHIRVSTRAEANQASLALSTAGLGGYVIGCE